MVRVSDQKLARQARRRQARSSSESHLPTDRPGLLQEVRIRWVQTQTMWAKVGDIISGVEGTVEDKLSYLWAVLTGEADNVRRAAAEKYDQVRGKVDQGKRGAEEKGERTKQGVEQMYEECKRKTGESKTKVAETYDEGRQRICESCDECKRRALEAYERSKGGAEQKMRLSSTRREGSTRKLKKPTRLARSVCMKGDKRQGNVSGTRSSVRERRSKARKGKSRKNCKGHLPFIERVASRKNL